MESTKKGAFPNGDAMDDKMQARILKYGQYCSDVKNRQLIKTTGKGIYITYTFYFTISNE